MSSVATVFYYDRRVKYSLNPVIASVDFLLNNNVYLIEDKGVLYRVIDYISRKYSKCIVGISLLTTFLIDNEFLKYINSINEYAHRRNCITIVGGPHASGDPVGCIESLGFDYVFIGEGEESMREFVEAVVNNYDLHSVKSIVSKFNDEIIFTGSRKPIVLDNYCPFPYWRYLFNPLEITRGCIYGCKYCQVSYIHGFKMRHRSIDKIIHYVSIMINNGIRDIRFVSPNSIAYGSTALGSPNYSVLEELLSKLYYEFVVKHSARVFFGTFPSEVRPDYVDEDVLKILRKYVANREIIIGAQSGSNRVLECVSRKHSVEDVVQAVELVHRYGFRTSVDFIMGLPGETNEDLFKTISIIEKLVSMGARVHLHTFIPLPGTPFASKKPSEIPIWFKKKIFKIIGRGRAYGEWIKQEELARKVIELREKGIIKTGYLKHL